MVREARDVCLRVLKESNVSRFDSYSATTTVYWSHPMLPFGIVPSTFFLTTFLEIAVYVELVSVFSGALARAKLAKIWLSIQQIKIVRAPIKSYQNSWSVSHGCITDSGVQPFTEVFFKVLRWPIIGFPVIKGSESFTWERHFLKAQFPQELRFWPWPNLYIWKNQRRWTDR